MLDFRKAFFSLDLNLRMILKRLHLCWDCDSRRRLYLIIIPAFTLLLSPSKTLSGLPPYPL